MEFCLSVGVIYCVTSLREAAILDWHDQKEAGDELVAPAFSSLYKKQYIRVILPVCLIFSVLIVERIYCVPKETLPNWVLCVFMAGLCMLQTRETERHNSILLRHFETSQCYPQCPSRSQRLLHVWILLTSSWFSWFQGPNATHYNLRLLLV